MLLVYILLLFCLLALIAILGLFLKSFKQKKKIREYLIKLYLKHIKNG